MARCWDIATKIEVDTDPFIRFVFWWLKRHCPKTGALALVHGDFHIRNMVIDGERLTAVLDWELARISNPIFDLAYMCIPYLSGKFFTPGSAYAGGLMPVDWLVAEYARRTGIAVDPAQFKLWRVLATLSLLLIIETGVTHYKRGRALDIRFAWLTFLEPVLQEDILHLLK